MSIPILNGNILVFSNYFVSAFSKDEFELELSRTCKVIYAYNQDSSGDTEETTG